MIAEAGRSLAMSKKGQKKEREKRSRSGQIFCFDLDLSERKGDASQWETRGLRVGSRAGGP